MNVPLILCTILLSYLIKVITCENVHGEEKWLIYVPAQAYAFGLYSVQRIPGKRLCWCLDSRACCCCQHKMQAPPVVAAPHASHQPWTTPDGTHLIPMPCTSSLPCQGVWLTLKCEMPQDSQHPSTWNPASWGRGCSMGWNLTNRRQLLAGKFRCFLLFGWTVCRGSTLSWILGWYSVWDGCDQLRNKSLVFLVYPSQPDSPFPSLLHSLSCTHTEA